MLGDGVLDLGDRELDTALVQVVEEFGQDVGRRRVDVDHGFGAENEAAHRRRR